MNSVNVLIHSSLFVYRLIGASGSHSYFGRPKAVTEMGTFGVLEAFVRSGVDNRSINCLCGVIYGGFFSF